MSKQQRRLLWVPIAVIAVFLATFAVLNFAGFVRFSTGDTYADVLVSRYLWASRSFFPAGWRFSNQRFILSTPNLAALLYGLTGRLNLSMGLAVTLMGGLCLVSFWYLVRPFCDRLGSACALAVLVAYVYNENAAFPQYDLDPLVCRISDLGQLLFTTVSYYSIYFIAACLAFGWYLRAAQPGAQPQRGVFVLALVLHFATGLQSLRQTQLAVLPLFALEALRLVRAVHSKRPGAARWPLAGQVLLLGGANLLGLLAARLWASAGAVTDFTAGGGGIPYKTKLVQIYAGLKGAAGIYKPSAWTLPSAPLHLFYYALALLVAGMAVWAARRLITAPGGGGPGALCVGLFVLSLAGTAAAVLFTDLAGIARYFFLYWPLAALCVGGAVTRLSTKRQTILVAAVGVFAALSFCFSYWPLLQSCFGGPPLPQQQAADWLQANGYTQIYAQFWTSGQIAVASDGAVSGGHWVFSNFYEVSPYLTAEDEYTEAAGQHAAYVFTAQDRDRALAAAAAQGVSLQYQTSVADTYYIYTSPVQLMHFTPDSGRDTGY